MLCQAWNVRDGIVARTRRNSASSPPATRIRPTPHPPVGEGLAPPSVLTAPHRTAPHPTSHLTVRRRSTQIVIPSAARNLLFLLCASLRTLRLCVIFSLLSFFSLFLLVFSLPNSTRAAAPPTDPTSKLAPPPHNSPPKQSPPISRSP